MHESVQTVNPRHLVCGNRCDSLFVPVYTSPDLMQPVFYPNQRGQKAESHTRLCQYVDMQSAAVILH